MSGVAAGLIFFAGILICVGLGYASVNEAREIVTPGAGFRLGAMLGMAIAACVLMVAFLALNFPRAELMRQSLPLLFLAVSGVGLCVCAAGIAGSVAALFKPNAWRHRRTVHVKPQALAPGSQHPFTWYFKGQSTVPVSSLRDMCHWLQTCEYTSDVAQFHTIDYWQQPVAFEGTRKGDCEDHALWAWRKLLELGYPAEFMLGRSYRSRAAGEYHAWVTFRRAGKRYLLEPTYKHFKMIEPLEEVQYLYQPTYSVDGNLQVYRYNGHRP